jgi:hypothetical protein
MAAGAARRYNGGFSMSIAKFAKEARRAARYSHDSVLEIMDEAGRVSDGAARLVDVSALGAKFADIRAFTEGARIRARMRLLNAGVIEVAGTVVRVQKKTNFTLYGVKFDSAPGGRPRPRPRRPAVALDKESVLL